ncbi:MAG TPA: hypothetical protein VG798_04130 [Rhizomicrobium sp.]|nr:hypothetical protein [Rhizomicrobium sp.]HWC63140.1 hypothetical protein [Rhizomicrobium sp.]
MAEKNSSEKAASKSAAAVSQVPAAKPALVDDASVKESFADDFVGLYGIGPNFHFTFATRRPAKAGSQDLSRLVTARIVLPLDAVLEMYNSLQTAVSRLESRGVIKRREPAAKGKK